jgi:gluconate 5-dehydrogenase
MPLPSSAPALSVADWLPPMDQQPDEPSARLDRPSPHAQRFSLKGRRALITGSTRGIGFALARGLAEAGATVILNGRDRIRLETAVVSLRQDDLPVLGAAFDATHEAETLSAITELDAGGKSIDILINNAGVQRRGPLLSTPLDDWNEVIRTNLTGAFIVARTVAPGMIARKFGKIVNICSLMSDLSRPTTGSYAAAKGGLRMLTRAMCAEWARDNVQINGLAPGYILTDGMRSLAKDAAFDRWIRDRTPAGRWGELEDLVGACVFLCSSASNFINGQILVADGGLSAVI